MSMVLNVTDSTELAGGYGGDGGYGGQEGQEGDEGKGGGERKGGDEGDALSLVSPLSLYPSLPDPHP
jgi:hypothetical protein